MKMTKYGHCCMVIEEKGVRILTDPGSFTIEAQESLDHIDIVLITHEHADHLHVPSVHAILKRNPAAKVICNPSVGAILQGEGIAHTVVGDGATAQVQDMTIEGFGSVHATIHPLLPKSENTGYFVAGKLWYPGDAFHNPGRPMEILALPVAGPWMKTEEAVDYALALKPKRVVPVHDGILNPTLLASGAFNRWYASILEGQGIAFLSVENGKEYEIA
jgi:L-ascorbate metabolism protein UlaG (beta-lactamase superfamily)